MKICSQLNEKLAPNRTNQRPVDKSKDKDYYMYLPYQGSTHTYLWQYRPVKGTKGQGTLPTQQEQECMTHLATKKQQPNV